MTKLLTGLRFCFLFNETMLVSKAVEHFKQDTTYAEAFLMANAQEVKRKRNVDKLVRRGSPGTQESWPLAALRPHTSFPTPCPETDGPMHALGAKEPAGIRSAGGGQKPHLK